MRTVIVAAAAMSGLINIAAANQPAHLHCAPKTTEIRVFLNQFSVAHGNWRDLSNLIGTGWSFVAKSRSSTNLIGDILSPRGDVSAENVSVPAGEWNCSTATRIKRARSVRW
jgi:hypothetical protein